MKKDSLKGKRLMILGGGMWKDAIKQYADDQGFSIIAAGNDPNSGMFEIADERIIVNSTNDDEMIKVISQNDIDGVYMGGSEPVISHAIGYLAELGYHCYASKEQWEALQNKENFKSLCIKHGLPVVENITLRYTDGILNHLQEIPYPVITKPTDGCGSNGFSVCLNSEEFKEGYKKAKENSHTGSVIVEKFVNNNGIVVFYTLSEGKLYFSGLEDKYPIKYEKHGSYVAGMFILESSLKERFKEMFESKLQNLANDLNLKEGSFWIEVFVDKDNFYFNEAGFRYGGSVSIYPIDYFYGINQVAADINYALTGKSLITDNISLIKPSIPKKKKYCMLAIHLRPGKISKISGFDEVLMLKNVVAFPKSKSIGSEIPDSGSIAQVFGFVHFVFEDLKELKEMINQIMDSLIIENEQGENLVVRKLNLNSIILK